MLAIAQKDIEYFIEDFENKSSIELLEGAKEKNELYKIAEAKGMIIKGSRDLAPFKTIYAFTDRANKNGAILPQKELLKVLPQIIGKPVSVNHNRRFVVGHYIDYRYIAKTKEIIAYGVFYKSNFGQEWEKAKELFKKKKLSSSFEIWSPTNARKFKLDGTYELHQMEIAGGALIFQDKDNEPAFKGADVLMIAKTLNVDSPDLVYATKYKENEIINSNQWKESIEENLKKLEQEKNPVYNMKCANCEHEFETTTLANVKCPQCFAILKSDGQMLYPPQIKDFSIACPSCRSSNWLITSTKDNIAEVQCQSCSKMFTIEFAVPEKSELLEKIKFLYVGHTSCPQCGTTIPLSGTSDVTEHEVTCNKCKLTFKVNTEKLKRSRQIKNIVEKTLEERRNEEKMTQEKEKDVKAEENKTDVETKEKTEEKTNVETEVKTEEKKEEPKAEAPKAEEKVDEKATTNKEVVESSTENTDEASGEAKETKTPSEESTESSKDTTTEQPAETATPETLAPTEEEQKETEKTETTTEEKVETIVEEKTDEVEVIDINDDFFEKLETSKTNVKEQSEKLTYQQRKNLKDSDFAVIKIVKNKRTGGKRKVRMFPIYDKAHVRNALARLPLATKTLEKLRVSPRTVKARILKRARQLGMKDLLQRHKASVAERKYVENLKASLDKAVQEIVKLKDDKKLEVSKVTAEAEKSVEEEIAKIRKEADEKIEVAMANAKTIVERRLVLGNYVENISDKDIVNDDVYGRIKLEKENAELRAKNQGGDDIVSSKTKRDEEFYKSTQDEITRKAFGSQKRDHIV